METPLTAATPDAVIVVGAGGHAKVIIEILRTADVEVAYCVARPDAASHCVGVPVLRTEDALDELYRRGYRKAVVALGDNRLRARLGQQLRAMGFANVHVEPFTMPVWTRGAESAELHRPVRQ